MILVILAILIVGALLLEVRKGKVASPFSVLTARGRGAPFSPFSSRAGEAPPFSL